MNYWLVKSDPKTYSFNDIEKDKTTSWDGVRNYQARNNLKLMKLNDLVLFYHSQDGKDIKGLTSVSKEFYQDPTTKDSNWVSVELRFIKKFSKPVTLDEIKTSDKLKNIALVKQSRLSVMPITEEEFNEILKLSE